MYRREALRAFLRRHTSDTLSMSNPVHGRATASSADRVRSARSQGFEPRNPSARGALHGRCQAYHGSALPTELRGHLAGNSPLRDAPTSPECVVSVAATQESSAAAYAAPPRCRVYIVARRAGAARA